VPSWTNYFLLRLLGGAMVDAMEFIRALQASNGVIPRRYRRLGTMLGEWVRLLIGGALAAVFFASHQVETPLAAVTVGATAPIIIERMLVRPPNH
jgi:hypothetical protein